MSSEQYSNSLNSFSPQEAPNMGFASYVRYYTAAQDTAFGQVCYIDSTNTAYLARADSAANCSGMLGISYGGQAGEQTTFLCLGYFNNSFGFSIGRPVYLSDTEWGGLQQNAPTNPASVTRSVGYTSALGVLSFNLGGIGAIGGFVTSGILTSLNSVTDYAVVQRGELFYLASVSLFGGALTTTVLSDDTGVYQLTDDSGNDTLTDDGILPANSITDDTGSYQLTDELGNQILAA